jgi:hypothetical protein
VVHRHGGHGTSWYGRSRYARPARQAVRLGDRA